jgi:hypothetical protein
MALGESAHTHHGKNQYYAGVEHVFRARLGISQFSCKELTRYHPKVIPELIPALEILT